MKQTHNVRITSGMEANLSSEGRMMQSFVLLVQVCKILLHIKVERQMWFALQYLNPTRTRLEFLEHFNISNEIFLEQHLTKLFIKEEYSVNLADEKRCDRKEETYWQENSTDHCRKQGAISCYLYRVWSAAAAPLRICNWVLIWCTVKKQMY
jgi:hypothetical protein